MCLLIYEFVFFVVYILLCSYYCIFIYFIFFIGCKDKNKYCESWVKCGECIKNLDFMIENCVKSCNKC